MNIAHIVFDLDGTLIDSSQSILATFAAILDAEKLTPRVPLDSLLIGPPLTATLKLISGLEDPVEIDRLTMAFKARYDSSGYRESAPIYGAELLLGELKKRGYPLYIVTNKRHHPTWLILEHLGWKDFFTDVYSPDSISPAYPSKASTLAALISNHNLAPSVSAYIGDTPEDADAAQQNSLYFFQATWGYGTWPSKPLGQILADPMDMLNHLPGNSAP